jgi:hypothetical protein
VRSLGRFLAITPYDWRTALRKDLSTLTGLCLGLLLVPLWRILCLQGLDAAWAAAPSAALGAGLVLGLYGLLHQLKKRRLFFYLPDSSSG